MTLFYVHAYSRDDMRRSGIVRRAYIVEAHDESDAAAKLRTYFADYRDEPLLRIVVTDRAAGGIYRDWGETRSPTEKGMREDKGDYVWEGAL